MTSIFRKEKKNAKTLKFSNGQNMWEYNTNLVMVGNSQGKKSNTYQTRMAEWNLGREKVAVAYFFHDT